MIVSPARIRVPAPGELSVTVGMRPMLLPPPPPEPVTVTLIVREIVVMPKLSVAKAVRNVNVPSRFWTGVHATLYGAVASSPMSTPSAKNWTDVTVPSESLALAVSVTGAPAENVEPSAGDVTVTVGGAEITTRLEEEATTLFLSSNARAAMR